MSAHIFHEHQPAITALSQRSNHKNGFYRVTKHRLCRICRKSDWCGYTIDEQTSICMRISKGSKGTSRNGGNIFHHNRLFLVAKPRFNKTPSQHLIEIAPIEIRNAVHEEMIRRSPASKYYSQLIDGPNGLLARGLGRSETQNYGALPRTRKERANLANILKKFVSVRFPGYAPQSDRAAVVGVPGLWQDESGKLQLVQSHDFNMPLLVVPYRDNQGRIQGCQLRLHENDLSPSKKKYRWLACPFPFRGASSGTPVHFTFKLADLPPGKTVIITEGALKAEALVRFRPKARVIATSGVSCSHAEIIEAARSYNALIAFDADYKTNPAVARQLARLIAAREQDIASRNLGTTTRIITWQRYKGIDDAVLANVALQAIPISQWVSTLEGKSLLEVQAVWQQMNYSPLT